MRRVGRKRQPGLAERDRRIIKMVKDEPFLSYETIGKLFADSRNPNGLTKQRISQIVNTGNHKEKV